VRPVIIEFTGTPDSGKTTTINHMRSLWWYRFSLYSNRRAS
jgi:broad-specificity NMP kinase